ncbi:MAG: hypothetical protein QOK40_2617, partial [Miltoncostaeaceae bacterium]|nr:hypothetical protein [Miltoncostaeaceae bacterium]
MNRIRLVLLAMLALIALPAGALALTSDVTQRLRTADVAAEAGAGVSAGDIARLDQAAADMRARGFPTKFVLVANASDATDGAASALRSQLGRSTVATVILLGPRRVGISSARPAAAIFNELRPAFRADPVGGAIQLADRLASSTGGSGSG